MSAARGKDVEAQARCPVVRSALLLAALVLALGGCASPDDGPTFSLSGSFTAEFDEADRAEFNAIVAPYSDDVAFLESFPEQFSIRGIEGGCEQLRATLGGKDYVATVSTCREETTTGAGDPDEATSSP